MLLLQVVLIFGIYGACRCIEITNITVNDIETHINVMIITLRDTKTKIDRTFVVGDASFAVVQKYYALRPVDVKTDRFFFNYKNCKCTKQVIGRHKIAQMPKIIATYLELPHPEQFTGHCFRRSSATILADTGANLITLKRHGGWKSDRVAESYIEESVENKNRITQKISQSISLKRTTSYEFQEASTSAQEPEEKNDEINEVINEEIIQQSNTALELSQTISNIKPGKSVLNFSNCTFHNCHFN